MDLMAWIILLFGIGMANMIIAFTAIQQFISRHADIENRGDLQIFKIMVRKQMYQTILQLIVLGAMGIAAAAGIITGKLSFREFIVTLILNAAIIILGMYGKKLEEKVRSYRIEDEKLAKEYISVCKSWVEKPFPDF